MRVNSRSQIRGRRWRTTTSTRRSRKRPATAARAGRYSKFRPTSQPAARRVPARTARSRPLQVAFHPGTFPPRMPARPCSSVQVPRSRAQARPPTPSSARAWPSTSATSSPRAFASSSRKDRLPLAFLVRTSYIPILILYLSLCLCLTLSLCLTVYLHFAWYPDTLTYDWLIRFKWTNFHSNFFFFFIFTFL